MIVAPEGDFADWLLRQLQTSGLSAASLSRVTKVSASTISRIVHRRSRPTKAVASRLGEQFSAVDEALIVAGYSAGSRTPRPPTVSAHALAEQMEKRFATWLWRLGLFGRSSGAEQSLDLQDVLSSLVEQVFARHESRPAITGRSEPLLHFRSVLFDAARTVTNGDSSAQLEEAIAGIERAVPDAQVRIPGELDDPRIQALDGVGLLRDLRGRNRLTLAACPALLPLDFMTLTDRRRWDMMSRQVHSEVQMEASPRLSREAQALLEGIHDRFHGSSPEFRGLSDEERQAAWLVAKVVGRLLWSLLGWQVNALGDPRRFFTEARALFAPPTNCVYVFASTPGLVLPEDLYGALLEQEVPIFGPRSTEVVDGNARRLADSWRRMSPARNGYFTHGIIHGCRGGTSVLYQWDKDMVAETLRTTKNTLGPGKAWDAYRSLAVDALAGFLELPNLEIRADSFAESEIPFGRWRHWLTHVSEDFAVVSVRGGQDQISHGLMFDGSLFDSLLPESAGGGLQSGAPSAAVVLADRVFRQGEVIKPLNSALPSDRAHSKAESVIAEMVGR